MRAPVPATYDERGVEEDDGGEVEAHGAHDAVKGPRVRTDALEQTVSPCIGRILDNERP